MNIKIQTNVKGNYREILARFDRALFEALAPRQPKMEIVEFTGSKKGDRVHIRFLQPLKVDWVSVITEDEISNAEAYFIDEGVQLPFPLTFWRHQHIVRKITDDTSCIIDDITFRGPNVLVTLLLYPAIYLGFYPRKKIYRRYFGKA
ncbi:MAG: cyclase [Phaeodactylibacter sp.]|nr:cyclase [Phaeodactylibacter sp.]